MKKTLPGNPGHPAARTGSAMVAEVPNLGVTRQRTPAPRVPPPPPFWLVFDPNRWDVIAGRVVPLLRTASARPGVNGVERAPDGRALPAAMLAQAEENGETVIPWDVDGEGTSYLRREAVTGGWFTRWETVYPGSDRITSDTEGYSKWLASLVERGFLPQCPAYVLHRMLDTYVARLEQFHAGGNAQANATQIESHQRSIDAIRAALEDLYEGAKPAAVVQADPAEDVAGLPAKPAPKKAPTKKAPAKKPAPDGE